MPRDNLLPNWFIISVEVIGIFLTLLLITSAIIQGIYLSKANDIFNKANDIQGRLVKIQETHIFPEIVKIAPTSPMIRGKINGSITIEFEMAYDGERVIKYYINWFAKSKAGGSGGINYKTHDEKILKIMHREKNSIYESFDFSFEKKGTYIVTANIYYSDEELQSNAPEKTEVELLTEIGKPLIQNFEIEVE